MDVGQKNDTTQLYPFELFILTLMEIKPTTKC